MGAGKNMLGARYLSREDELGLLLEIRETRFGVSGPVDYEFQVTPCPPPSR
jgi:hypothetical protein